MTEVNTLGAKITQLRKLEGVSQQELCKLTGAGLSAIKNLEAGTSDNLSTKTFFAIANHPRFKKYALWLIGIDSKVPGDGAATNPLDKFAEILQTLNDEEVTQVVQYLEFLVSKRK